MQIYKYEDGVENREWLELLSEKYFENSWIIDLGATDHMIYSS